MLSVPKFKKFATAETQTINVVNKTLSKSRLSSQNLSNSAGPLPTVSSDLDLPATMTVCRICLAMNMRMYHISKHKLRVMYERVTGLEIKSEDMLPQQLCWECTARLLSANNFMEKALKTHWILMNITCRSRLVTIRDVQSVDRGKNQLESSLSPEFYDVNHSNTHIFNETLDTDITNVTTGKTVSCNKDITQTIFFDHKVTMDCSDNNEQINSEEVNICKKKVQNSSEQLEANDQVDKEHINIKENIMFNALIDDNYTINEIKSENADISYEEIVYSVKEENISDEEVAGDTESNREMSQEDNEHINTKENIMFNDLIDDNYTINEIKSENPDISYDEIVNSVKEENISDEEVAGNTKSNREMSQEDNEIVDQLESIEVCEVLKQRRERRNESPTPQRNQKSATLPRRKELVVLLEDIMLSKDNVQNSCKQLAASGSSATDNENGYRFLIKDRIVFEKDDVLEAISARTSIGNSDNLAPNYTESLKKLFICNICDKQFHWKSTLVRHIRKYPKLYNCTHCSYKVYQKSNLKRHINSKHTKSIVFNCSYCIYKTCDKITLNKHINSKHTKSTVFNCSFCSYKAYGKGSLDKHINSKHTKSTVLNCTYCSYKTYLKSNLNQHINSQHTKSTVSPTSRISTAPHLPAPSSRARRAAVRSATRLKN